EAEHSPTKNPFCMQCRSMAEHLEILTSMVFNLNAAQHQRIIPFITPILSLSNSLKEIPEIADNIQIYKAFSSLAQAATYLSGIIENGLDQLEDFNPQLPKKESVTDQELKELQNQVDSLFNALIIKLNEFYQDIWATLLMNVRNQMVRL